MFGIARWRERAAARWLARMGNESAAFDRAAFERWRARSAGNARAFDELSATWQMALPAPLTEAHQESGKPAFRWRQALAGVAAIVLALAGSAAIQRLRTLRSAAAEVAPVKIANNGGSSRTVRLQDGSVVTLWPSTVLSASFTHRARRLDLATGRARFEVAHEARPFLVHAVSSIVTARGTIFEVGVAGTGVEVALIRGSIDVARRNGGASVEVRRLRPGEHVRIPETGSIGRVEGRDGRAMLDFDATTIAEAVDAFNARNDRQIAIADYRVAAERITGAFRATDPRGFAAVVADMFDLAIEDVEGRPLLLKAKR